MRHGILQTTATWLSAPRSGWELAAFILGALGVGAIVLGLLMTVPPRHRKWFVMAVTFVGGLFYSVEFLWGRENYLTTMKPFVAEAQATVWSFALFLGVWNLFQIHGKSLRKLSSGWYNSLAFFLAFFAIVMAGFLQDWGMGKLAGMTARSPGFAATSAASKAYTSTYEILYQGLLVSLESTMFSLIAFYIVSAAYRAFRVRSAESALMMVTAAIIMLSLVPVGVAITNSLPPDSPFRIEKIGYWILTSPNMTAQRAIGFGIAVGALAMGLRIWLGLEKGSFFDRQL
jgi:hypothetical protein